MRSHIRASFAFMCLCVGMLVLLAACTKVGAGETTSSTTAGSGSTTSTVSVHSQSVTPSPSTQTRVNSQPTSMSSPQAASSNAQPTRPTQSAQPTQPVEPTQPPSQPVKVPTPKVPTPPAMGGNDGLTLTLSCSGPNGSDGVSVTNSHARACVYTSPGAKLTISVSFCNGNADPSSALQGTFTAGASGFYEWNWTPQASCQPISSYNATVTAKLNGSVATVSQGSTL